jgi:NTE family protein
VTTAFVLTGGSIKGAFQAGALEVLLERGKIPGFVSGVSVGSLNALWLADAAGGSEGAPDWPALGRGLSAFWRDNVRRPADLVRERGLLELTLGVAFRRFDGVLDTQPLRSLIARSFARERLARSPLACVIGAVDYYKGTIAFYDQRDPEIFELAAGSCAIPVAMPAAQTSRAVLFDGGLRDMAPLKPAMKSGATEIVVVACQPRVMTTHPTLDPNLSHRDMRKLAERVADIVTTEILNDDLEYACEINQVLRLGRAAELGFARGKTERSLLVIRPNHELLADITDFDADQVSALLEAGRQRAREVLEGAYDYCADVAAREPSV